MHSETNALEKKSKDKQENQEFVFFKQTFFFLSHKGDKFCQD